MRNRRLSLVLLGAIVVIGSLAVGIVLFRTTRPQESPEQPPTPPAMSPVVMAAQNIPRGQRITEGAVYLQNWPTDSIPAGALTTLEQAYNQIARVDIARGTLLAVDMLTNQPGEVLGAGSEASMVIPEGRVAYALPISRYTGVAWALRPGDHVDVLISLLLVNLDEEFQTILPNRASCLTIVEGETCQLDQRGRLEVLPNGYVINLTPSEPQRPRLVTQLAVQDAVVLRVGDWPFPDTVATSQPGGMETTTTGQTGQEGEATPPAPTILPLTLAVTPQDAIALEYALLSNARVSLVLRSAANGSFVSTDPVTLQYLMSRYNIELPPLLPYGVTPPVTSFPPPQ